MSTEFSHQEAVVGEELRLSCSPAFQAVVWKHTPVGSNEENDVYVSGNMVKPYDKRFKVVKDYTTGDFVLTVSSVQRIDSGTYVCMRADEDGPKYKTELIVLGNDDFISIFVVRGLRHSRTTYLLLLSYYSWNN